MLDYFSFQSMPPYGMPPLTGVLDYPHISSGPDGTGGPDSSGGSDGPGDPGGPGGPEHAAGPYQETLQAEIYVEDGSLKLSQTREKFQHLQPSSISDINISSGEPELGGVYVKGSNSKTVLRNSSVFLTGPGADDFSGVGAGVMCEDGAELELHNVNIDTAGIIRCCTTATDHSVLRVYDSTLSSVGGNVPEGYSPRGPMCHPPQPLGITGDCRTHLTMNNSESYFYDSTIRARSWGALSTDSSMGYVYLEANRCFIETVEDGYCAYADGGCHDVFRDCRIQSAAMGIILAGDSTALFQNTAAVCRTNLAMIHSVMGAKPVVSALHITGCHISTDGPVIWVKSANTAITISSSRLVSAAGVLIRSCINDDRHATKVLPGQTLYGINIRLSDGSYTGDVIHEDRARTMALVLSNAELTGVVQNVYLSIGMGAKWFASANSTVCLVNMDTAERIDASVGTTIVAVAGKDCMLHGHYVLKSGGILNVQDMQCCNPG